MAIDRECPNCGTHDRELDRHGVYRIDSTGFGAGNDEWTWYCSVWCRDASYGIPPMFRCLKQAKLSDFDDEGERTDDTTAVPEVVA